MRRMGDVDAALTRVDDNDIVASGPRRTRPSMVAMGTGSLTRAMGSNLGSMLAESVKSSKFFDILASQHLISGHVQLACHFITTAIRDCHEANLFALSRLCYVKGKVLQAAVSCFPSSSSPLSAGSVSLAFPCSLTPTQSEIKACGAGSNPRLLGASSSNEVKTHRRRLSFDPNGMFWNVLDHVLDRSSASTNSVFRSHWDVLLDCLKCFSQAKDLGIAIFDHVLQFKCDQRSTDAILSIIFPLWLWSGWRSDDFVRNGVHLFLGSVNQSRDSKRNSINSSNALDLLTLSNTCKDALQIAVDYGYTTRVIRGYLQLAELEIMQDHPKNAKIYFESARDLLFALYFDGPKFLLASVATPSFIDKILKLVMRMVRFLFVFDGVTINSNIMIIDALLQLQLLAQQAPYKPAAPGVLSNDASAPGGSKTIFPNSFPKDHPDEFSNNSIAAPAFLKTVVGDADDWSRDDPLGVGNRIWRCIHILKQQSKKNSREVKNSNKALLYHWKNCLIARRAKRGTVSMFKNNLPLGCVDVVFSIFGCQDAYTFDTVLAVQAEQLKLGGSPLPALRCVYMLLIDSVLVSYVPLSNCKVSTRVAGSTPDPYLPSERVIAGAVDSESDDASTFSSNKPDHVLGVLTEGVIDGISPAGSGTPCSTRDSEKRLSQSVDVDQGTVDVDFIRHLVGMSTSDKELPVLAKSFVTMLNAKWNEIESSIENVLSIINKKESTANHPSADPRDRLSRMVSVAALSPMAPARASGTPRSSIMSFWVSQEKKEAEELLKNAQHVTRKPFILLMSLALYPMPMEVHAKRVSVRAVSMFEAFMGANRPLAWCKPHKAQIMLQYLTCYNSATAESSSGTPLECSRREYAMDVWLKYFKMAPGISIVDPHLKSAASLPMPYSSALVKSNKKVSHYHKKYKCINFVEVSDSETGQPVVLPNSNAPAFVYPTTVPTQIPLTNVVHLLGASLSKPQAAVMEPEPTSSASSQTGPGVDQLLSDRLADTKSGKYTSPLPLYGSLSFITNAAPLPHLLHAIAKSHSEFYYPVIVCSYADLLDPHWSLLYLLGYVVLSSSSSSYRSDVDCSLLFTPDECVKKVLKRLSHVHEAYAKGMQYILAPFSFSFSATKTVEDAYRKGIKPGASKTLLAPLRDPYQLLMASVEALWRDDGAMVTVFNPPRFRAN